MNKQKEAEMLEDIAFIKEHFKPDVTLPQSLQGQQLRRRLEHTKAVPKPALRPLYWKLAPMACAFALVLGLSVYAVSANGWSKQITAENNAMAMDPLSLSYPHLFTPSVYPDTGFSSAKPTEPGYWEKP